DLAKPGIQVVTPNPFTSGGARWNVMAAYGAELRAGKTSKQAIAYLDKLFHNVVSQDTSARNALQTFLSGRGDVLLTYENEAILAQKQSKPVYYLIPKATIQIENPLALTTSGKSKAEARAFYNYLYSPAAQTLFARAAAADGRRRARLSQRRRPDPARRAHGEGRGRRLGSLLGCRVESGGGCGAEAHALALGGRRCDQRAERNGDRVGARSRPLCRQGTCERADRLPVRAAHDRREPYAARALQAAERGRKARRLHTHRTGCRA